METTLAYIIQLLGVVPQLIGAGTNIVAQWQARVQSAQTMVTEQRDPTPEEWDALNSTIAALRTQLHR